MCSTHRLPPDERDDSCLCEPSSLPAIGHAGGKSPSSASHRSTMFRDVSARTHRPGSMLLPRGQDALRRPPPFPLPPPSPPFSCPLPSIWARTSELSGGRWDDERVGGSGPGRMALILHENSHARMAAWSPSKQFMASRGPCKKTLARAEEIRDARGSSS